MLNSFALKEYKVKRREGNPQYVLSHLRLVRVHKDGVPDVLRWRHLTIFATGRVALKTKCGYCDASRAPRVSSR